MAQGPPENDGGGDTAGQSLLAGAVITLKVKATFYDTALCNLEPQNRNHRPCAIKSLH